MIKTILTDIAGAATVILFCLLLVLAEISADHLPPISGVSWLRLEMARYEATGPDMMIDQNKD